MTSQQQSDKGVDKIDKVRALFEHFDANGDGYLTYPELRRFQLDTGGGDLDGPTFCKLLAQLGCDKGLTLDALRSTYDADANDDADSDDGGDEGSDGGQADIDADYEKIFPHLVAAQRQLTVMDDLTRDDEFASVFKELNAPESSNNTNIASWQTQVDEEEDNDEAEISASRTRGSLSSQHVSSATKIDNKTMVQALHRHFDSNRDKHLNYLELAALKKATTGISLEGPEYCQLCREHSCDPRKGISLKALQSLYEEDSEADLDGDFFEVFQGRDPKDVTKESRSRGETNTINNSSTTNDTSNSDEEITCNVVTTTSRFSMPAIAVPTLAMPEMPTPTQISRMLFGGVSGRITPVSSKSNSDKDDAESNAEGEEVSTQEGEEAQLISPSHISRMLFGVGDRMGPATKSITANGEPDDHGNCDEDEEKSPTKRELSGLLSRGSPKSPKIQVEDQVRALHRFFDVDGDDLLNYCELRNMQLRTSGDDLDPEEYRLICLELDINPREGLTLEALQKTYSSGDGDIREDYRNVFPNDSVAAIFSSYDDRDADEVNLRGDFPHLAAERLDKVALLFEHFDADKDGLLSYKELRQLQLDTSGEDMDGVQYMSVCQLYEREPSEGLTLEDLQKLYLSSGSDSSLDEDYRKVYRELIWGAHWGSMSDKKNEVSPVGGDTKNVEEEDEGDRALKEKEAAEATPVEPPKDILSEPIAVHAIARTHSSQDGDII